MVNSQHPHPPLSRSNSAPATARLWMTGLALVLSAAASLPAAEVSGAGSSAFLIVEPQPVRLFETGVQQLLVTVRDANARDTDGTTRARFTSSHPDIADVSSTGLVRGGQAGTATITIQVDNREVVVPVTVSPADQAPPVTFLNDVGPILTKLSCNSGGCHGKSTGQNGFRLSLLGFEPDFDHLALVHEARGRRLSISDPDHSLLLQKAIARMPHGGGKRLDPASMDYQVLHDWIRQGAPGPSDKDVLLQRVTVTPGKRVLSRGAKQQLIVLAHFADGTTRDVTHRAMYDSNEPDLATVNERGLVSIGPQGGLFAIMASFGGMIDVFRGTVPLSDAAPDNNPQAPITPLPTLDIDRHLFAQWKQLGIVPSTLADDATFIRRAFIDICGTLPTAEEVQSYLADQRSDKQARLIDQLLERPEFASNFAIKWADILQNRGAGYGTSQQRAGTALFTAWIRDAFAENKPYDQFVAEILTATGSQEQNPPTVWYRQVRTTKDYVESIAQAFLGVRIQCAQCHHHPAERWSQADYYSLAAVFARVGRKGGFADAEVPTSETIFLKQDGEVLHPRTGDVMHPRPLGGPDFTLTRYEDPRRALVRWMTAPDNPYFARTMANRLWGHFLGRGIVHPIDDMRSTNPPSNPELLDALAADFVRSGYDIKQLIRTITGSAAYRVSSIPNDTNRGDRQSFARYYPRRLRAEVLLDGISQVLEVPTQFPGGPGKFPAGTRAIELPDENVPINFLNVFGRPGRTTACECERTDDPALDQALELVNSKEVQRKLTAADGYIERLATNDAPLPQNVHDIFLRVFARTPTAAELATAVDFLAAESDRREAYRSLLWSLLATNEFLFNR